MQQQRQYTHNEKPGPPFAIGTPLEKSMSREKQIPDWNGIGKTKTTTSLLRALKGKDP